MKTLLIIGLLTVLALVGVNHAAASAADQPTEPTSVEQSKTQQDRDSRTSVRKVLFLGDSMTGWMAERLNAYGLENNFEVAAIIWDGSTIRKWGDSNRIADFIREQKPDAVFISLGLNELFERNPEAVLKTTVDNIIREIGQTPYLWIGPPSWPGKSEGAVLNNWLEKKLGPEHYYNSSDLKLARQSATNPHPTRDAIIKWMDAVAAWIPQNTSLNFQSLSSPGATKMDRPRVWIYKKMKERL